MKTVFCLHSIEEYDPNLQVDEYLCGVKEVSRQGNITLEQLDDLIDKRPGRIILNWDLLMTQDVFERLLSCVDRILPKVDSVRVSDLGALNYLRTNHSDVPIQLSLEAKGRNLRELKFWQQLLGTQLERLVLSNEISHEKLGQYIDAIDVPIEILGLGPLRLAYTPRKLFSRDHVFIDSMESVHKNYPVIQNDHGTQMFHVKDLSILENINDLKEIGVDYLRIDLPGGMKGHDVMQYIMGDKKSLNYPRATTRGFFKSNRSDIIFSKLKNENIIRTDKNYVGDVVEVNKGNYIAIMLRNSKIGLTVGDRIHLKTPDGKHKYATIHFIKNSSLQNLDYANCDQLVLINHVKGTSVRSACYLCHDD